MSTLSGCLTLAGAAGALALTFGDADACAVLTGNTDTVTNYASLCSGSPRDGVCMASIRQALSCAVSNITTLQGTNQTSVTYTLVVGATHPNPITYDLTTDASAPNSVPIDAPFDFTPMNAPGFPNLYPSTRQMEAGQPFTTVCAGGTSQSSCLVITGPSTSNNTTLLTNTVFPTFVGNNMSHVLIEHLTIKQYPETILNGAYAGRGTTMVKSNTGSIVGTLYTVDVGNIYGSTHPVEDPANLAAINPTASGVGSQYACTSGTTSSSTCQVTVSLTDLKNAGGNCQVAPIIAFTLTTGGYLGDATQLIQPAQCKVYPLSTAPYPTQCVNNGSVTCSAGTNASVYLSFTPTPLTQFNNYINAIDKQIEKTGSPSQTEPSLHAYTNANTPARINSSQSAQVLNLVRWGHSAFNNIDYYFPPIYNSATGNWTLVLTDAATTNTPDPWINQYYISGNYAPVPLIGLHGDSGKGVQFNAGNGSQQFVDIVFSDMTWIGSARNLIEHTRGVQLLSNTIMRDPEYTPQQLFLAASGGFQIGQPNDTPIWGTTINNYVSQGTGDDSIAIFDDAGKPSAGAFLQSRISNSTLTDSTNRSINLNNSEQATGLCNSMQGSNPCGGRPLLDVAGPIVPGGTVLIDPTVNVPNLDVCKAPANGYGVTWTNSGTVTPPCTN